eukprot:scaffold1381_cov386-Prasinococcus_capsulatus_cf.AAC.15
MSSGKPQNIAEKMVQGRLSKFYEEVALLEQKFVVDESKKVKAVIADAAKEAGCAPGSTRAKTLRAESAVATSSGTTHCKCCGGERHSGARLSWCSSRGCSAGRACRTRPARLAAPPTSVASPLPSGADGTPHRAQRSTRAIPPPAPSRRAAAARPCAPPWPAGKQASKQASKRAEPSGAVYRSARHVTSRLGPRRRRPPGGCRVRVPVPAGRRRPRTQTRARVGAKTHAVSLAAVRHMNFPIRPDSRRRPPS